MSVGTGNAAVLAGGVQRGALVGNRWVLVGGFVYLLEFVGIIWAGTVGVSATLVRGTPVGELSDSYVGNENAVAAMAGWLGLVLLGRVLLFAGLRHSLAASGHSHPLMDLAVVAAAISVTLEIAANGLAITAASRAAADDEAGMLLADQAGSGLGMMLAGGLGVAITCSAYVMWRSGLFPLALNVVGLVCGVAITLAQLAAPPALQTVYDILYVFPIVFWVWMLWAGVVCWRRTPRATVVGSVDESSAARG
jgi:hypothetical protein